MVVSVCTWPSPEKGSRMLLVAEEIEQTNFRDVVANLVWVFYELQVRFTDINCLDAPLPFTMEEYGLPSSCPPFIRCKCTLIK